MHCFEFSFVFFTFAKRVDIFKIAIFHYTFGISSIPNSCLLELH